jgi:beta-glucosidase
VSDLLVAGSKRYDFTGKLPFSWPKSACQVDLNVGDKGYAPLFAWGYGLKASTRSKLGTLDATYPAGGCGISNTFPVFSQADRASFPLAIRSGAQQLVLGADLNSSFSLPGVTVQTSQVNTQQDAKLVTWTGPATIEARGARAMSLPAAASANAALRFDTIVSTAPAGKVSMRMGGGTLDTTALFQRLAGKGKQTVSIPLTCFQAKGTDLSKVDAPFSVSSDAGFAAAFTSIEIAGGAAGEPGAVRCEDLR